MDGVCDRAEQRPSTFQNFNGNTVQITQGGNANLFAASAAIQSALHALIPAIGVQRGGQNPIFAPARPVRWPLERPRWASHGRSVFAVGLDADDALGAR